VSRPKSGTSKLAATKVSEKWLKDRKGRQLTSDDLTRYHHIVSALNETIRLMSEIDAVIEAHDGWPIS
jgi:uncharacterized protein